MVINDHQWSSVVIKGHQLQLFGANLMRDAINGHQWSSMVISGHQRSSVVIKGHQLQLFGANLELPPHLFTLAHQLLALVLLLEHHVLRLAIALLQILDLRGAIKGHQEVIRRSSGGHQEVIRRQSRGAIQVRAPGRFLDLRFERVDFAREHAHLMRDAIKGSQRSSEVIRGHQSLASTRT